MHPPVFVCTLVPFLVFAANWELRPAWRRGACAAAGADVTGLLAVSWRLPVSGSEPVPCKHAQHLLPSLPFPHHAPSPPSPPRLMESHDGAERGDVAAVELAGRSAPGSGRLKGSCRPGDTPAAADTPCPITGREEERATAVVEEEAAPACRAEKVREEGGQQQNLVNKMGELGAEAESGLSQRTAPPRTDGSIPEDGSPDQTAEGDRNHSASEPSLPAESQSIDSLESFSNLNSCPSSDLNSEGAEDRALALALQTEEYNSKDGVAKPSSSKEKFLGQSVYHIKWIKWKTENTPIITQNENGPCPLLAIMNVLLLAWKIKLPPMMEIITAEQLMEYLGDYILDAKPKEITDVQRLNYEQNMSDAMAILHKLQTGLDVNVKFTGVRVFEYTPECIVFDLLDIALYHGWLVDPQTADVATAVGMCSYNQLVEKIILCKQSENSELVSEGFVAEQFLNRTATQLTFHGLCELISTVEDGELCVFFRNNHFSTMTKHKGQLYLLVTDQGFLTEEKVVWESLHNVDGDGNFCDSEFHLRPPSDPETVYKGQQDQIDQEQQSQDLSWEQIPEGISDLELAKKLQEEEDRRASQFYHEQEQAAAAQSQEGQQSQAAAAGKQPGGTERKARKEPREKEKDKCILL
ncbi:ubiquitin carboxyl-terminal hydrolase MINDY-2 isoform X2 [Scyliorhinus canicula]|uniref:ubiquitin carboxyl-terminal hydrolase MINDY-2 isoform X2 n=1 Tax=Scyliorhinus canicula TaxID=7830 RepID=UPI0018F4421A|nr:ubiquitin carboxyl-terminal hydrolase MINDY-2 isoform X2 [Scyliorhinus canicula]